MVPKKTRGESSVVQLSPDALYASPKQVRLWHRVNRIHAPVHSRPEIDACLCRAAEDGFRRGGKTEQVLILGCGTGEKELAFCQSGSSRPAMITLVDVAPDLVATACAKAESAYPQAQIRTEVLNFLHADLTSLVSARPGGLVLCCFGILANQDPVGMLKEVAEWIRPGDRLVLGLNCVPGPDDQDRARILPQYDNLETRQWLAAALERLGLDSCDFRLQWSWGQSSDGWGWRLQADAVVTRDLEIPWSGGSRSLAMGDRIEVFSTHRFDPEPKGLPLWPRCGFEATLSVVSACREEAVVWLQRIG